MVKISQERDELVAITAVPWPLIARIRQQFIRFWREDRHSRHQDISLSTDIKLIIKSQRQRSNHTYFFTEFLEYMEQSFALLLLLLPDSLNIVLCGPESGLHQISHSLGLETLEEISRKVLSTKDDFLELILKTTSDKILSSTNS